MGTVHCPLCGLRFARGADLDHHARDDHAPPPAAEGRAHVTVPRSRRADDLETPLDRVLRR
jgi:hypothetical protein